MAVLLAPVSFVSNDDIPNAVLQSPPSLFALFEPSRRFALVASNFNTASITGGTIGAISSVSLNKSHFELQMKCL